jgi:hypothetical protein
MDTQTSQVRLKRPARSLTAAESWRRPYLVILLSLFLATASLAAFVTVVDPYDLYSWGVPPHLDRRQYDPNELPWLLNVVANGDYDTFLIGGSTAQQFEARDIEKALTGTRRAFAITYSGPKPRDLAVVMQKVSSARNLRRVLLSFDNSYVFPPDQARANFPFELYDTNPLNDLRAASFDELELALRLVLGQEYFLKKWDYARTIEDWSKHYQQNLQPAIAAERRRIISARRQAVAAPARLDCSSYPALSIIHAFAVSLAKRGARLDVVVPPYSYFLYYDYFDPNKRQIVLNNPPLGAFLVMRKCLLQTLAADENARVYAFDLNAEIVEDMANYRDEAHLFGAKWGAFMLKAVDQDRNRLTLSTFDAYADALRDRVARYDYRNSRLEVSR